MKPLMNNYELRKVNNNEQPSAGVHQVSIDLEIENTIDLVIT